MSQYEGAGQQQQWPPMQTQLLESVSGEGASCSDGDVLWILVVDVGDGRCIHGIPVQHRILITLCGEDRDGTYFHQGHISEMEKRTKSSAMRAYQCTCALLNTRQGHE
jgi:hypothetical protein